MSRNKKHFNSLSLRLLLIIIALLAASFAAVVVFVSRVSHDNAYKDKQEYATAIAHGTVLSLTDFINEHGNIAKLLCKQRVVVQALEAGDEGQAAQARLRSYLDNYEDIASIYAFDRRGVVVAGLTADGEDERGRDKSRHTSVAQVLEGRGLVIDPVVAQRNGSQIVYRIAHPVLDADGALLGGIQLSVDIDSFNASFIDPVSVGRTGYPFILDSKHRIISHPKDKSLLLQDKSDLPFIREMVATKKGSLRYEYAGQDKMLSYESEPQTGWIVAVNATEQEMLEGAVHMRNIIIATAAAICLALCLVVGFTLRRMVVRPVLAVQRFAAETASGDYAAVLEGRFSCELADLASNIQTMRDKIKTELSFAKGVLHGLTMPCSVVTPDNTMRFINQHMMQAIGRKGRPEDHLGQTSGAFFYGDEGHETISVLALRSGNRERSESEYRTFDGRHTIFDVTAVPIRDMDGHSLGVLSTWFELTEIRTQQRQIEEQNVKISEAAASANKVSDRLAAAATELASQIEESSRGSELQSERITETATAVEQMNASILEVARHAGNAAGNADNAKTKAESGANVVGDAVRAIETIRARVVEMAASLDTLGQQAEGIGNVIGIISDIADQTNLLALNAAIEAARAGDAGRGFAVVADEVRKLAEKTMAATKEVDQAITSIQAGTRKSIEYVELAEQDVRSSVEMAGRAGDALREIVEVSVDTADMVRNIATAAEEQSAASEQITHSTGEISSIAGETAAAMGESAQAVSDLAMMAEELKAIIEDMSN